MEHILREVHVSGLLLRRLAMPHVIIIMGISVLVIRIVRIICARNMVSPAEASRTFGVAGPLAEYALIN